MKKILSLRKHPYIARVGIFLIAIALIAGMVSCGGGGPKHNLTMAVTPGGSGTATDVTGTSPYAAGTVVSIKAVAAQGYLFVKWTAPAGTFGNATAAETTFTMPAQDVTVTANFFQGHLIRDWNDLYAITNNLGDNYLLMNNLNSTTAGYTELASSAANEARGWDPIGIAYGSIFNGTFDGQGYELRDLFINRPDENGTALFVGVDVGGVIESVKMVNANVAGGSGVGILVGASNGTVDNCSATGDVTGSGEAIGGLVGWAADGIVDSSHATVSVTGSDGSKYVGGLVGAISVGATVSNSYATGNVTGSGNSHQVGGLVGGSSGTVDSSHATGRVIGSGDMVEWGDVGGLVGGNGGNVSNSYATGSVTGNTLVGGLVGGNEASGTVDICYATGSVTGTISSHEVGGLVGGDVGTVHSSYATGSVTGGSNSDDVGGLVGFIIYGTVDNSYATGSVTGSMRVGGLVGWNQNSTVNNSYSTGFVTGSFFVGGLVGGNFSITTVNNSFWDNQTSGQATSAGGTGKTTLQMKAFATFNGLWDIITVANSSTRNTGRVWNIVDTVTYPFLSWQP